MQPKHHNPSNQNPKIMKRELLSKFQREGAPTYTAPERLREVGPLSSLHKSVGGALSLKAKSVDALFTQPKWANGETSRVKDISPMG